MVSPRPAHPCDTRGKVTNTTTATPRIRPDRRSRRAEQTSTERDFADLVPLCLSPQVPDHEGDRGQPDVRDEGDRGRDARPVRCRREDQRERQRVQAQVVRSIQRA